MERPIIELSCGGVMLTIKRPDTGGNSGGNVAVIQLTERQRRIYHQIAARADITAKKMAVILNIPSRTLERELASMQARGIIRHEGKARTGRWVILTKF